METSLKRYLALMLKIVTSPAIVLPGIEWMVRCLCDGCMRLWLAKANVHLVSHLNQLNSVCHVLKQDIGGNLARALPGRVREWLGKDVYGDS